MAAFPHQISQPPLPHPRAPSPPTSRSSVLISSCFFLKAEICFSSAGSGANRLSFPCGRQISSNSLPFTISPQEPPAEVPPCASTQCGSSRAAFCTLTRWKPLKHVGGECWNVTGQTFCLYIQNRIVKTLIATLAWSLVPPGFRLVCKTAFPACCPTMCRSFELSSCQRDFQRWSVCVLSQKVFSGPFM